MKFTVHVAAETIELQLPPGSTIEDVLRSVDASLNATVMRGGDVLDLADEVYAGDDLRVTPEAKSGEAPMPTLRQFKKCLKRIYGMQPAAKGSPTGRGDHEKWVHPDGWSIDVNPRRSDRKEVDQASVADLARKLGVPFGDVYQKVMTKI